jgi:hypothetical protein
VKLIRTTKTRMLFHLGHWEAHLLLEVLNLYPCLPPAHQQLSKTGRVPESDADQRLLDEALMEHRTENRRQLQALLADRRRLAPTETGGRLSLPPSEVEWLLQVLNDIRVGSWVRLGSPDEKPVTLNEKTAPHYRAMEGAGYFEAQLLEALSEGHEM